MTLLFHCVRHQKKLFLIYQIHVVMIHGQFSMTHWRLTFQATFPCSLKGKNINRQLIKSYQILLNETRNLQVKKNCSFVINNSIVPFKVSIADMIFLFLYQHKRLASWNSNHIYIRCDLNTMESDHIWIFVHIMLVGFYCDMIYSLYVIVIVGSIKYPGIYTTKKYAIYSIQIVSAPTLLIYII